MRLKVYPVGEDDEDRYWLLELTDDRVTLTDNKDRVRGDWSAKKAVKRFQMPDFWTSKKGFSIDTDKGLVALDLDAGQMRKVKEFVDRQYVR